MECRLLSVMTPYLNNTASPQSPFDVCELMRPATRTLGVNQLLL